MGITNKLFSFLPATIQTFSNVVLLDTGLNFDVPAGRIAIGTYYLPLSLGANNSGIRLQLTASSLPTLYRHDLTYIDVSTDTIFTWAQSAQANATYNYPSLGLHFARGNFVIRANAAANVKLQYAQMNSNALVLQILQGALMEFIIV